MSLTGDRVNCRIEPAHAFTRRAMIQGAPGDFRRWVFAFWLAALTWRRQAGSKAYAS